MIAAVPRWAWSLKETSRPTMIQYIDKIVGGPRRVKHQVTTAQCEARQMLAIQTCRRKTLAGNGIVMARAGSTARVGRPVELSHRSSTLMGSLMSECDTTTNISHSYSSGDGKGRRTRNEVRAGSLEVQVQKGSPDIRKFMIAETADDSARTAHVVVFFFFKIFFCFLTFFLCFCFLRPHVYIVDAQCHSAQMLIVSVARQRILIYPAWLSQPL